MALDSEGQRHVVAAPLQRVDRVANPLDLLPTWSLLAVAIAVEPLGLVPLVADPLVLVDRVVPVGLLAWPLELPQPLTTNAEAVRRKRHAWTRLSRGREFDLTCPSVADANAAHIWHGRTVAKRPSLP